jgi:hypothetical protein
MISIDEVGKLSISLSGHNILLISPMKRMLGAYASRFGDVPYCSPNVASPEDSNYS